LRHTSATGVPSSAWRSRKATRASVDLDCMMVSPRLSAQAAERENPTSERSKKPAAGHIRDRTFCEPSG
jgi:hypothetical protein